MPSVDGLLTADGRIKHVAWHDFHLDATESDIYVKKSDLTGSFNLAENIIDNQFTDGSLRSEIPYSAAQLIKDPLNNIYSLWTESSPPVHECWFYR